MSRAGGAGRALGLALMLGACGGGDAAGPASTDPLGLSFEDVAQPAAFAREGPATRAGPGEAEGSWAVVADLPRPEAALVVNLESGARTRVALFEGAPGAGAAVRLSAAAAEALGIGERTVPVRVTALRREPRLRGRGDVF